MGFKKRWTQASAAAGIVGALAGSGGDPAVRNTSSGLSQQHIKYAKEVRLPETRREIERTLRTATRSKNNASKDTALVNKKELKRLK